MFLIVHRTRAGWVQANHALVFGSEAEAREMIPTLAKLLNKPPAALAVIEQHIHDAQFA